MFNCKNQMLRNNLFNNLILKELSFLLMRNFMKKLRQKIILVLFCLDMKIKSCTPLHIKMDLKDV